MQYPINCPYCKDKSDEQIRAEIRLICNKCGVTEISYNFTRKKTAQTLIPCKICDQFPTFKNIEDIGCEMHGGFMVRCEACRNAFVISNTPGQTIKMWNELQNKDA